MLAARGMMIIASGPAKLSAGVTTWSRRIQVLRQGCLLTLPSGSRSRNRGLLLARSLSSTSSSAGSTSPGNNHQTATQDDLDAADHRWRQQNHIWTPAELAAKVATKNMKHRPTSLSDHAMQKTMKIMYHGFNFVTGYRSVDPSPQSIEWRLILLESFAGVPGFLAAMLRHFYSLRTMKRDHGRIYTLLEEAENERMHLFVCMKMFEASWVTRIGVQLVQFSMVPFLLTVYIIRPEMLHRFVGYLEETAVHTYSDIIENAETPGTQLHEAWSGLPAPGIAKAYWQLSHDATWVDTLKHILADEAHHRDVNHTFADLPESAENPFKEEHVQNFEHAVRRHSMNADSYKNQNMAESENPLHK